MSSHPAHKKKQPALLLIRCAKENDAIAFRIPRKKVTEILTYAYTRQRPDNGPIQPTSQTPKPPNASVDLVFTNDECMSRWHMQFMNIEGSTDVMSFADGSIHPATQRLHIGDIAVCIDTAKREAMERGKKMEDEALLYGLHGFLHLLGWDDLEESARIAMMYEQEAILQHFGLTMD